jgi:hypothetical protein
MATWKPELHSVDAILSYYDQYDEASYSVYAGSKPEQAYCRFTYTGNDKEIGREKLHEALMSVQSNPDNTNTYLLQILQPKGKKLETTNAITFQLNKTQSVMPYNPMMGGFHPQVNNEVASLKAEIAALKMKLENEDIEDDDNEDDQEPPSFISGLMNNPQVQAMILSSLSGILNPQKVTSVAGVSEITEDQKTKIHQAIEILLQYDDKLGDDLLLLSDLAKNDSGQFNFLLKMLRK